MTEWPMSIFNGLPQGLLSSQILIVIIWIKDVWGTWRQNKVTTYSKEPFLAQTIHQPQEGSLELLKSKKKKLPDLLDSGRQMQIYRL